MDNTGLQEKRAQAITCLNSNKFHEACRLLQEICQTVQHDVDAWFMLGVAYGQLGAYKEAEQCCRQVTDLQPQAFAAWDNLGISLMFQDRNREAEICFRRALEIKPDHAPGYNHLGNLLRTTGGLADALACYQQAISINPSFAEAINNQGIAFRELGRLDEAVQSFARALKIRPEYPDAYHNLGDTYKQRGDLEGALQNYQQALRLNPNLPESLQALGTLLEELNRHEEALACHSRALEINPGMQQALVSRARLLAEQGHLAQASAQLHRAMNTQPDSPDVLAALASLAALEGKYQDAYDLLRPCIESESDNINIALAYATVSRQVGSQEEARSFIERVIEKSQLPDKAAEEARFALGKLHEDLGDFDQAFEQYQMANHARCWESDLAKHIHEMERIRTFFNPQILASLPRAHNDSGMPVFIVGMPRSGTSLVEQILAAHPLVHGGGELTKLWKISQALPGLAGGQKAYPACLRLLKQEQLDRSAQQYLDFLSGLNNSARIVTDKLPHNFLHLGLIQLLFPGARIIHCIRDARDTCLSIYSHKFNINHVYARNLEELGKYYLSYLRLMAHWKKVIDLPIHEIHYEQLVQDPETGTREIVSFCDLPWDKNCLRFHESGRIVHTPSRDQVRHPVYTSAVGRWQSFAGHLGPLFAALDNKAVD